MHWLSGNICEYLSADKLKKVNSVGLAMSEHPIINAL